MGVSTPVTCQTLSYKQYLDRLEHYKRFQKAKQAKQKETTKAVKDAFKSNAKDEKAKDSSSRTSVDSKAYEKKLAREKERDAEWSNDAQWRRDILSGRRKKPETSPAERKDNDNGHDTDAKVATEEVTNEPEAAT